MNSRYLRGNKVPPGNKCYNLQAGLDTKVAGSLTSEPWWKPLQAVILARIIGILVIFITQWFTWGVFYDNVNSGIKMWAAGRRCEAVTK